MKIIECSFCSQQEVMKNGSLHPLPMSDPPKERNWPRTCLIFTALVVVGVFVALGSLTIWHARLISRGETSIEAHINASEIKRLAAFGKVYENPYNFGRKINWKVFLGLTNGRSWRHVLLPSRHRPDSNGMTWATLANLEDLEIAAVKAK
ncbi:hypothetical protein B566_EDAN004208 [Ephemera danica]|nr:hypothetical protein B566_EDAN004208 [Ephemera danica]